MRNLGPDDVDLWIVHPAEVTGNELLRRFRSWLAPDEVARLDRFHFPQHRHEYLITRALARTALSNYRDLDPAAWQFRANAYGRPEIVPHGRLVFNLTNTLSLIACGVAEDRALGIDTEPLARADQILSVASTVFCQDELADLHRLGPEAARDRAVSLWTIKEAYMKARGMGMSLPPRDISVAFEDKPSLVAAPLEDKPQDWTLQTLDVRGHRIAVASPSPQPRIELIEHRW